MFTNKSLQYRYSFIFVASILGAFIFVMIKSLGGGSGGFETSFYERMALIGSFNNLCYRLGDHVFPQVLVGKDGWLDFTSDGNLSDYQNANLSAEKLESIHQQVIALNQNLKTRGITLIVAVAPNKETIYPDKVPDEIKKLNDRSRLDLFLKLFNGPDSPIVLDLRPALNQARGDHQIYYKTDTHWNAYGAYVAYREILNSASKVYPDLQPHGPDDFQFVASPPQTLELSRLLGGGFLQEPIITAQPEFESGAYFKRIPPLSNISVSTANHGQQRKLLIYHDSFGVALNAFLQYNFKEAVYVLNSADEDFLSTVWIDTLPPDIVVIEIAERNLIYLDDLLSKLLRGKG